MASKRGVAVCAPLRGETTRAVATLGSMITARAELPQERRGSRPRERDTRERRNPAEAGLLLDVTVRPVGRKSAYQPNPMPTPAELSDSLNAPPKLTVARAVTARW